MTKQEFMESLHKEIARLFAQAYLNDDCTAISMVRRKHSFHMSAINGQMEVGADYENNKLTLYWKRTGRALQRSEVIYKCSEEDDHDAVIQSLCAGIRDALGRIDGNRFSFSWNVDPYDGRMYEPDEDSLTLDEEIGSQLEMRGDEGEDVLQEKPKKERRKLFGDLKKKQVSDDEFEDAGEPEEIADEPQDEAPEPWDESMDESFDEDAQEGFERDEEP